MERGGQRTAEEMRPSDYVYNAFKVTTSTLSRITSYITSSPIIFGSVVVGVIGAIAGIRIAQYQAMRRRRNVYERVWDTLGGFIGSTIFGRPKGRTEMFMERGRELSSVMGEIPFARRPRREAPENAIKQVGYALSLIPIAFALIRNPLVRDVGFRLLSRRMTPHR